MKNNAGHSIRRTILDTLGEAGVQFTAFEHLPSKTAAEAAEKRQTPLNMGVKAMVIKFDGKFAVFALRADREIRSRLIRTHFRARRTRFATEAELFELTGLRPGAVPPFGHPILPLRLFADPRILDQKTVVFTAGLRDFSISLASHDWYLVARPELVTFSRSSASTS